MLVGVIVVGVVGVVGGPSLCGTAAVLQCGAAVPWWCSAAAAAAAVLVVVAVSAVAAVVEGEGRRDRGGHWRRGRREGREAAVA